MNNEVGTFLHESFINVEYLALFLLVGAFSFASFRIVVALRRSNSAGVFRNFAGIPIVYCLLIVGAFPFLCWEKLSTLAGAVSNRRSLLHEAEFVGNKESRVFHAAGCEYLEMMAFEKRVALPDVEKAMKSGYRPCATCRPTSNKNLNN